jgi:hypothetical protein
VRNKAERFLIVLLLFVLASCTSQEFSLDGTIGFPVYDEDSKAESLALFATFNVPTDQQVQMEITSPQGDVWTLMADPVQIGELWYWGSSLLEHQDLQPGTYHLKAMRRDGKVLQTDVSVRWDGEPPALPEAFVSDGQLQWKGKATLAYRFLSSSGVVISSGEGESGVVIPKEAARLELSHHDDGTNWTVRRTIPL